MYYSLGDNSFRIFIFFHSAYSTTKVYNDLRREPT